LVGVSPERPRLHTRKQLEGMVEVLSNRKPLKGVIFDTRATNQEANRQAVKAVAVSTG